MGVTTHFAGAASYLSSLNFLNYNLVSQTATKLILKYQNPSDPLNSGTDIKTIILDVSGVTAYVVEEGDRAGETVITGGTLTGIKLYTDSNDLMYKSTGLNVDLAALYQVAGGLSSVLAVLMTYQGGGTIVGSAVADFLYTGMDNDLVIGGDGNDLFFDVGGSDTYKGGAGSDSLDYQGFGGLNFLGRLSGITVDLKLGTATGPDGNADTLVSIENIQGTNFADTISGSFSDNLFAGLGGADVFDGLGGTDTVSYAFDADYGGGDGIRGDLRTGLVRDGFGTIDTLTNIENITGTSQKDILYDNFRDNVFVGGAGDDFLSFSAGTDTGTGGAGLDTFIFRGTAFGDDTITDFSQADGDQIKINAATGMGDLTIADDGFGNAEITFGANTITLTGVAFGDLSASDFIF